MTKKYNIVGKYIKDMSSETADIETYLFVRDRISNYQLGIDINSKALKDKKDLEKIVLCDVQTEIYPDLEKSLLDLLHNSGYPGIKFEKKIDFENLYNQRFN